MPNGNIPEQHFSTPIDLKTFGDRTLTTIKIPFTPEEAVAIQAIEQFYVDHFCGPSHDGQHVRAMREKMNLKSVTRYHDRGIIFAAHTETLSAIEAIQQESSLHENNTYRKSLRDLQQLLVNFFLVAHSDHS